MQSFKTSPLSFTLTNSDMYYHSPFYLRGDEGGKNVTRFVDLGEFEQHSSAFHQAEEAVGLSKSSIYSDMKPNNVACIPSNLQFSALCSSLGSREMGSSAAGVVDTGQLMLQKCAAAQNSAVCVGNSGVSGNGHLENWADSGLADHSRQTDTSTDVDTDDRIQFRGIQYESVIVADSMEQSNGKCWDHKTLRRLAQNREAARKSRLRKKAYVQQLENSQLKLTQLEQDLKRACQQGLYVGAGVSGEQSHYKGALAFDMDYARWLDEHQRLISDLRSAVNSQLGDNGLRLLVDEVMSHYDEIFRLKSIAVKSDVFHMLSGMWKTPAERCFMWLGGFRSSELLKILGSHLEPLTDQQLVGICNLQQSCQQAEDALSQGMEALQQSLVDTLSSNCLGPAGSGNVADYMGQMAVAMSKLAMLENFLYQADMLRQQTLHQMHHILTTRQAARALLVIGDYMSRLRALSALWSARPKNFANSPPR